MISIACCCLVDWTGVRVRWVIYNKNKKQIQGRHSGPSWGSRDVQGIGKSATLTSLLVCNLVEAVLEHLVQVHRLIVFRRHFKWHTHTRTRKRKNFIGCLMHYPGHWYPIWTLVVLLLHLSHPRALSRQGQGAPIKDSYCNNKPYFPQ